MRVPVSVLLVVGLAACSRDTTDVKLTKETLYNAHYVSEVVDGGDVKLTDGEFYDLEDRITIRIWDPIVYGDLNADGVEDAVVVLVSQAGGSGTFYHMHAVLNDGGKPVDYAFAFLGDRIKLETLSVDEDGAIDLRMLTHHQRDPMCCPTVQSNDKYRLKEGALVK